ncbi:MAG: FmdB family zinc ribbon protein [Myxococcales bacterium]
MPTYEYSCTSCGTFDVEQRITEAALSACDKCGGPVQRLISRSSFALRGGGWYADGYSAGKKPAAAGDCASKPGGSCGGGACKRAEG